jgi:hypothetical protein
VLTTLLTGAGLSFSAGLNAYLPLLILALADRLTHTVDLDAPYSGLSSNWGVLALLVLLPVELFADKIPKLDHYNNILHTAIRPLAAALCFMAVASQDDSLNVWLAGVLGLVIGAGTHLWKMRERPGVTAGTNGLGNPFVSVLEDGTAIVVSIVAIAAPIANLVLIPGAVTLLHRTFGRMSRGESRLIKAFQPRPRG